MSDDDEDGAMTANQGITLPESKDATYDASLSPFFLGRTGRVNYNDSEDIINRGRNTYFWTRVSRNENGAYRIGFNASTIHPSYINNSLFGYPLRCLVSTNNRIIINLVSDENINSQPWAIDQGYTLPKGIGWGATYNIWLSPFFLSRTGQALTPYSSGAPVRSTGSDGKLYPSTVRDYSTIYFLYVGNYDAFVWPAYRDSGTYSFSLRCLVSTNNRIRDKEGGFDFSFDSDSTFITVLALFYFLQGFHVFSLANNML